MPWVESSSETFRARHDSAETAGAERILLALEDLREQLAEALPHTVSEMTVVLHRSQMSLTLSNPTLSVRRLATAPAARRYVAGWVGSRELHVLGPAALAVRASNVPGSREMLALSAPALYARRVIAENNRDLSRALTPARFSAELRWAWLLEGAARWFARQIDYARPAIARRLHEGARPSFPPGVRDATLLGATVIDLLARQEGESAALRFVTRLHPQGARTALSEAFASRPLAHIESDWRSHLRRLARPTQ